MDEPKVEALNGPIEVGDRLAVAIGAGRHGNGMRVGTIIEIDPGPLRGGSYDRARVKLRVEQSSGYHWQPMPYIKTYDDTSRMVKL